MFKPKGSVQGCLSGTDQLWVGPSGNNRRILKVSDSWAFKEAATFTKQELTASKYRQVLRKTHEERAPGDARHLLAVIRKGEYQQRSRDISVGGTSSYRLTVVQTGVSLY